jgi:hypothetical protein
VNVQGALDKNVQSKRLKKKKNALKLYLIVLLREKILKTGMMKKYKKRNWIFLASKKKSS